MERWLVAYDAVELAPFVALRKAPRILGLASAVLAEILCGAGDDVGEELNLDAAERFTWNKRRIRINVVKSIKKAILLQRFCRERISKCRREKIIRLQDLESQNKNKYIYRILHQTSLLLLVRQSTMY